jgi:tetratricopeptide (TPR) repeat protein
MSAEPVPSLDRERRLDEVIAAYLDALESGTAPDRDEVLARHPDLADELAAFFADERHFDSLVAPIRQATPDGKGSGTAPRSADPALGSLRYFGDYELLGEIARGGMGVVYKARQVSLNRPVAVKVILAGQFASDDDVQRFRLEAEAAANLDHPNIVPIYEVGEHDGRPYFSMKLIEGEHLGRHARRFVERPAEAARLLETVARAVHHAHERGILHRDLKPANVLVDGAGRPHVTDFGLAKRTAVAGAEGADAGLTHTGMALGTPSYMAPEQAGGRNRGLTTAADVYSLGAILYELLTGQPPFKAETPLETLIQVREQDPPPPRSLNAAVPADLETIVLKCLDKDPGRRYASAGALADDLDRHLGGEPIQARPVGPAGRLYLWCRRNPLLAALLALAAAGLTATATVSVLFAVAQARHADRLARVAAEAQEQRRKAEQTAEALGREEEQTQAALLDAREQRKKAEENAVQLGEKERQAQEALLEARAQRARADESLRQANQAVHDFALHACDELEKVPGLQKLRKELLTNALEYNQDFMRRCGDDPGRRADVAQTAVRVGDISHRIGLRSEAARAYGQAATIYGQLADADPKSETWRKELLSALYNRGIQQSAIGDQAGALESVGRALPMAERLFQDDPTNVTNAHHLADVYMLFASIRSDRGQTDEALALYAQSRALFEQLVCILPGETWPEWGLSLCLNNTAVVYGRLDRPRDALRLQEQARAIRERVVELRPKDNGARIGLAASLRDLGVTHDRLGHRAEALRLYQQVLPLREQIARDNPNVPQFQNDLAVSHSDLGGFYLDDHQLKEALEEFKKSRDVHQELVKIDGTVWGYQRDLARDHLHCGMVLAEANQLGDASRAFGNARVIQDKVVRANPERADYNADLAGMLGHLGRALVELKKPEEAVPVLREAVEHQAFALGKVPQSAAYRTGLSNRYADLAEADRALGRTADAVAALQERRKLWPENGGELYRVACDLALTGDKVGLGKAELSEAEQEQRRLCADLAVDTLRDAFAAGFRDADRARKDLPALRGRDDFQRLLDQYTK